MKTQSNVSRGTEYEKFVQSMYEAVLRAEGVENLSVQHNIKLKGQSGGEHQIDLFWEFKLAGQIYRTAIECKDFDKSIPVGRVRDFYAVISDIPNLTGIFATKIDYQSGAIKFAKQKGISLKIVREPTDLDWEGRLRTINLNLRLIIPMITNFEPRITPTAIEKLKTNGINQVNSGFLSNESIIFGPAGNPIATYDDLRSKLPHHSTPVVSAKHFIPYPSHILKVGGHDIEIDGCDLTYRVDIIDDQMIISGDEFVRAVLTDAESREINFVEKKP